MGVPTCETSARGRSARQGSVAACFTVDSAEHCEDNGKGTKADRRRFFEIAQAKDKTFKLYEGYYHEVLNEVGREQVISDLKAWLENHTARDEKKMRKTEG